MLVEEFKWCINSDVRAFLNEKEVENLDGENKGQSPLSQPICNYFKQSGHIISECIALKRKREKERRESPKPTGLTSLRLKPQTFIRESYFCQNI